MNRRLVSVAVVVGAIAALGGIAAGRPGGGDSYSGGGGHGDGGGGGGSDVGAIFELVYWIIRLCFYYPAIGLPLLGALIAYVIYSAHKQRVNKDWDSGPPATQPRVHLEAVRTIDPHFSAIVFEDFAFRLCSTVHRARGSAESLAQVGPYVSQVARLTLGSMKPVGVPVTQVIVGAMRPYRVDVPEGGEAAATADARVRVALEFEANIATADKTYFTVEAWVFTRAANVRTKPPTTNRTFPCPSCGAPWQASGTGSQRCSSCDQIVDNGRFDWVVEQVALSSIDERPPTLTTDVTERGTSLPTYRHREVDRRFKAFQAEDPAIDAQALAARVTLIHREVSTAWSNNDLTAARGLVSDGLYDYLDYWVQAYKQQGLRNVMQDFRITKTELAKVARDRWYDAVTIRLWATGFDYVIEDKTGSVVRGSKRRQRPYSEYWTLVRSAARKGPAKADRSCGNCGAPLSVTMAGSCEHCGAHVTAGEFDWVLSKIEQDDSYRG